MIKIGLLTGLVFLVSFCHGQNPNFPFYGKFIKQELQNIDLTLYSKIELLKVEGNDTFKYQEYIISNGKLKKEIEYTKTNDGNLLTNELLFNWNNDHLQSMAIKRDDKDSIFYLYEYRFPQITLWEKRREKTTLLSIQKFNKDSTINVEKRMDANGKVYNWVEFLYSKKSMSRKLYEGKRLQSETIISELDPFNEIEYFSDYNDFSNGIQNENNNKITQFEKKTLNGLNQVVQRVVCFSDGDVIVYNYSYNNGLLSSIGSILSNGKKKLIIYKYYK
ncbi:hypothetical protein [Edaphocola aurantiacus]|uniref:hypothetical protein n=1 Tax=Edaphocola aurantiacus TaxID=2601682 RepID=UPI001C956C14|nr:hypothetical protein [Edaphocola aurantiacus]